jgi:hypothetical protein
MPFRIAFELEGTLADVGGALRRQNQHLAPADAPDVPAIDDPPAWNQVDWVNGFWTVLTETEPGIVTRLAETSRQRRWEVIFLTTLPAAAGDTVQIRGQRWLKARGFEWPAVFAAQGSRGRIASSLHIDAIVDGSVENCLDAASESKATPILIWRADLSVVPESVKRTSIRVTSSAADALYILQHLDSVQSRPAGVLQTIKKFLNRG